MISIRVVFLGPAKDFARVESACVELADGATLADLRGKLVERYPGLTPALATIRWAVNQEFADDDTVLTDGDEVALIPPVSGGDQTDQFWVDLVDGPIPIDRVRAFVMGDPTLGGIVTFEGTTRREIDPEHGPLIRLDYEAYGQMAQTQLERIAGEAVRRCGGGGGRVAIMHRLGGVPVGEVSVMIAVAAGHRAESFAACRRLIDTLKKDVPIWKKDVFADGYSRWVKGVAEEVEGQKVEGRKSEPSTLDL